MSLPAVGDEILGKYRILKLLGRGGMGVVYAATHVELQETVAIKMLTPELIEREEVVVRFMREARAAAKIKNEHAVRVLDVGKLADGVPYMVMEFLEGEDLEHVLAARGPLPLKDAIAYIAESATALGEAHRLGIVHRDIKPANLFLATRSNGSRVVKVLDFGISKVTNDAMLAGSGATRTEAVMGTPMYMSPEQLRSSRDVDARADVWSLGVVFYELMTGAFPFDGESLPVLYSAILGLPYKPIRQLRPDLPPAIEQIVARCLEKDRDKRFGSVEEFVAALAPHADAAGAGLVVGGTNTARVGSGNWTRGATDATLFADVPKPTVPSRSGRTVAIAAVFGLVAVGVGLAVWSQLGGSTDTTAEQAAGSKSAAATTPAVIPAGQVTATAEPQATALATAPTEPPAASSASGASTGQPPVKVGVSTPLGTATVKTAGPAVKPTGTNKVFDVGGRK